MAVQLGCGVNVFSPELYVLVASFVLWALISRTTFFRNMRLMGGNDRTAFASGVRLSARASGRT